MARGTLNRNKAAKAEKAAKGSALDDMKIDPISMMDQIKGMARDFTFGNLYGAHTADKVQPRGTREAEAKAKAEAQAKAQGKAKTPGGTGAGQSQAEKRADAQAAQANQNTESLAVKVTEGNDNLRGTLNRTMGQVTFLLKSIDKKMSLLLEKDFGGSGLDLPLPGGGSKKGTTPTKSSGSKWGTRAKVGGGILAGGVLSYQLAKMFGFGETESTVAGAAGAVGGGVLAHQATKAVPAVAEGAKGVTTAAEGASKASTASKILGKAAVPLMLGMAAFDAHGNETNKDLTREQKNEKHGGTAGGLAGGFAGAAAGGALGALGGPLAPVTVPLGAIVGAIAGSMGGSALGETGVSLLQSKGTNSLGEKLAGPDSDYNGSKAAKAFLEKREKDKKDQDTKTKGTMGRAVVDLTAATVANTETLDDQNKKTTDLMEAMDKSKGATMGAISSLWSTIKDVGSGAVETGKEVAAKAEYGYKEGGVAGAIVETGGAVKAGAKKAYGSLESGLAVSKGLAVGRYTDEEQAAIKTAQASGERFKAGSGMDQATKDKIATVAAKHGVPAEHLLAMAQMESGGNKNAVSSTGASGLFQFTGGTGKQYGITNRFDADQNIDAAARLYKDNKAHLEKQGIEASMDNMYIAHQQGAGGAAQILKAAQGKGTISDAVAKNIGLNVGGNAGSPQGFLDANKKHLAAASLKANTYTAPAQPVGATQVAAVAAQPKTPQVAAVSVTEPKVAKVDDTKVAATSTVPTLAPVVEQQKPKVQIASATVSAGLPEKIQPSVPAESQKVTVANMPAPEKKEAPVVIATGQGGGGNSQVIASLQDIPIFFPDVSLMPLLRGMV